MRHGRAKNITAAAWIEHKSCFWPLEDQPLISCRVFVLWHRMKPVVHERLKPVNDGLAGFRGFHGLHELGNKIIVAQFNARLANVAIFGNGPVAASKGANKFVFHGCVVAMAAHAASTATPTSIAAIATICSTDTQDISSAPCAPRIRKGKLLLSVIGGMRTCPALQRKLFFTKSFFFVCFR